MCIKMMRNVTTYFKMHSEKKKKCTQVLNGNFNNAKTIITFAPA